MLLLASESNQACEKLSCFLSAWHIVEELNRRSNKFRHSEVFWLVIIAIKSSVSSPPPPFLPKREFDDKVTWLCLSLKKIERCKNSRMLQATWKACKEKFSWMSKMKICCMQAPKYMVDLKIMRNVWWREAGRGGREGWMLPSFGCLYGVLEFHHLGDYILLISHQ